MRESTGGDPARAGATCVFVQWRGVAFATGLAGELLWTQPYGWSPYGWFGTLISDKEDGTGTFYRRNRSVDPMTGRFTQEDPIGVAGGLNLYGFAGGDPVNFSDPFGLIACCFASVGSPGDIAIGEAVIEAIIMRTVVPDAVRMFDEGSRDMLSLLAVGMAIQGLLETSVGPGVARSSSRSLGEPASLRGATTQEVRALVPENYTAAASRRGGGMRFADPKRPGNQIRIMPGSPNAPDPLHQGPYVVISVDGKVSRVPLAGDPAIER